MKKPEGLRVWFGAKLCKPGFQSLAMCTKFSTNIEKLMTSILSSLFVPFLAFTLSNFKLKTVSARLWYFSPLTRQVRLWLVCPTKLQQRPVSGTAEPTQTPYQNCQTLKSRFAKFGTKPDPQPLWFFHLVKASQDRYQNFMT
jgi:hypothetical protein